MLWLCLCLSFCLVFVVEWDQPARCEGAFVMKTIMPFTFGRQPIGLLESRQRSSLEKFKKLFGVGLISNFSKGSKPRTASLFSHIHLIREPVKKYLADFVS